MELNLIDKLILLALDDDKGTIVASSSTFSYALASTIIIELALSNRIEVLDKKVKVIDNSPTNDPIIDLHFEKIISTEKEKTLKYWIETFGNQVGKIKDSTIEKLVNAKILFEKEGKILWVFNNNKYPTQNPTPEINLRNRLDQVVLQNAEPTLEEVMLLSLVVTSELTKEVFRNENPKKVKEKIKELAQNSPVAKSMHKVIKAIHEELMATIVLLMTTTVIISS